MKTFLRSTILLLAALWVGGVMFFPVVAWAAFRSLHNTQAAGSVVRLCLRMLHAEGLMAGLLLVGLLLVSGLVGAYGRIVVGSITVTVVMLGLTAYSQYSVMPRMESDRIALGGSVEYAPLADPHRAEFDRLHSSSEAIEEGVLAAGVLLLILLARSPRQGLRSTPATLSGSPAQEDEAAMINPVQ